MQTNIKYLINLCLIIIIAPAIVTAWTSSTEMVPMRDSVHLATEVYLPTEYSEPLPVVLQRTPYGRGVDESLIILITDVLGYALVSQNLRGRYDSEGESRVFLTDGWGVLQDGYDCIEWLLGQEWCDGNIGMWGASAPGMTQYFCAGAGHPSLKCIVPVFAGPSLYHHVAYNGGVLRKALVERWLSSVGSPEMIDTVAAHANYDELWAQANLAERWDFADVPAYHVTGWYDLYTDGQIETFVQMQERFGNQKLLITPWGHGGAERTRYQGDLVYPPNAELDEETLINIALEWYNYWLKGDSTGILDKPPITFYLTGDCDTDDTTYWNKWVTAEEWPLPTMQYKNYYLKVGNSIDSIFPEVNGIDTFPYDPAEPCPSIGGREYMGISLGYGPKDQSPIETREDVLVYTTPELDEPLAVIGKLKFILFASSNRTDTDWAIKVTDVYPDGRSILMTDNILMARHRHGLDSEILLTPGVIDTFEIDLWSIGHVFNEGHQIRVIITSSNYPRFEKNPNTGNPFMRDDPDMLIATNTVFRSPVYPSYLLLPVMPPEYISIAGAARVNLPEKMDISTYPNPFNGSVSIEINLAKALHAKSVQMEIYDIKGNLVRSINKPYSLIPNSRSLSFSWRPSRDVPSGIYLLKARAAKCVETSRILYIK